MFQLIGRDLTLNEGMEFFVFFDTEEDAKTYLAKKPEKERNELDYMEIPADKEITINISGKQVSDFILTAHVSAADLCNYYNLQSEEGKEEFLSILFEKGYTPEFNEDPYYKDINVRYKEE